jgi:hypothetical protein
MTDWNNRNRKKQEKRLRSLVIDCTLLTVAGLYLLWLIVA